MKMELKVVWCYLMLMLVNNQNSGIFVSAKNYETQNLVSCRGPIGDSFKPFLNATIQHSSQVGVICGGHCCDNKTEAEVLKKSTKLFEEFIKHQLKSFKGLWDSTHSKYKDIIIDYSELIAPSLNKRFVEQISDHVLGLSHQSENKTLNLFSTVYRRMAPLSRTPILELYKSIRSHISSQKILQTEEELEGVIEKFFHNLFPLAYHHAVHSRNADEETTTRDFHIDYKNCLEKSYDALQPFGDIPTSISRLLLQSLGTANTLLRSIEQGALILGETEMLSVDSLNDKCRNAIFKMNYCTTCKGHNFYHSKPCYGYCSNIARGCLTQFLGGLDANWGSFSEAIERLVTIVRGKDGIESVVKNLDGKLSEAIMHAMTNGPELEKKVHKICGSPSIHQSSRSSSYESLHSNEQTVDGPSLEKKQVPPIFHGSKWSPPPDTEILLFLTNIERFKSLSLQLANSYCDDDRYKKQDRDCWTGKQVGDYTHKIMDMQSQKYNPEVPTQQINNNDRFHQLNDKLITVKNVVDRQMTHFMRQDSDKMLSDMADGSGYNKSEDSDEYDDYSGSGDGISDHPETPVFQPGTPSDTPHNPHSTRTNSCSSLKTSLAISSTMFLFLFALSLKQS